MRVLSSPTTVTIIAGSCAVESREQLLETARAVAQAGAHVLRGGAFKPRTSPFSFQGLGEEALEYLVEAKRVTGLAVVTEVLDPRHIEKVGEVADIFQVGSRNSQNYELLKELGCQKKPVFLKRGMALSLEEYLMAAEYILQGGNRQVILCERGIRTFETSTRFTLDLSSVPILQKQTHLPVFVDPSHGVGKAEFVPSMAKAAIAVGADGLMIEVHPDPQKALCDGPQALLPSGFGNLMGELERLAQAVGRTLQIQERTSSLSGTVINNSIFHLS